MERLTNTLSVIYSFMYFPTYSNGLKDIGRYLGCSWNQPDASGIQSMVWRSRWEATRDGDLKAKLLAYNLDDCAALKKVTELIQKIAVNAKSGKELSALGNDIPPASMVHDVDKLANDRKWGKVRFFHPEYEYINDCAYFDGNSGI